MSRNCKHKWELYYKAQNEKTVYRCEKCWKYDVVKGKKVKENGLAKR